MPEATLGLGPCCSNLPVIPAHRQRPHAFHKSCMEQHYGFCVSRDSARQREIRQVHKWLGHVTAGWKVTSTRHLCFLLESGERSLCVLFLRRLRQVRTGQTLLVFVECSAPVDDGGGVQIVRMQRDCAHERLKCVTSWQVAVAICAGEPVRAKRIEYLLPEPHTRLWEMEVVRQTDVGGDWSVEEPPQAARVPRKGKAWAAVGHLRKAERSTGGPARKRQRRATAPAAPAMQDGEQPPVVVGRFERALGLHPVVGHGVGPAELAPGDFDRDEPMESAEEVLLLGTITPALMSLLHLTPSPQPVNCLGHFLLPLFGV